MHVCMRARNEARGVMYAGQKRKQMTSNPIKTKENDGMNHCQSVRWQSLGPSKWKHNYTNTSRPKQGRFEKFYVKLAEWDGVCMWALLPSAAALRSERVRCPRSAHWPD